MINRLINIFIRRAAVISCFFICSCSNNYQEVQDLAKKKVAVDVVTKVENYLSQDGIVKAKLTAPLMTITNSDTPQTEFPRSLHVDFYDSTTKVTSQLSSKYGLYYNNKKLVLLKDSVVVFNITGDTLRTQKLWWDQDKELLYTDAPVHIMQQGQPLEGRNGMTAKQDFSAWSILDAKGTLPVADSTLPTN